MHASINRSSNTTRAAIFAVVSLSAAAGAAWGLPCCPPSECGDGKPIEVRGEAVGGWMPQISRAWSAGKAEAEGALQAAQRAYGQAMAQAGDQARAFTWRSSGGGGGNGVWAADPQGQSVWLRTPGAQGGHWVGAVAGDDDKVQVRVFGKAVIVGPDGKTREFKFGDGSGGGDDGDAKVIIKRIGPDGDDGDASMKQFHEHLHRKIEGSLRGLHGLQGLHGVEGLQGLHAIGGMTPGTDGAWIGVQIAEPDEVEVQGFQIAPGEATRIEKVIEGSPAARGGVQDGDVVVRIGGRDGAGVQQLQEAVRAARPGSPLRVEVIREGERLPLVLRPQVRAGVRIDAQDDGDLSPADAQQRIQRIEERMNHIEKMLERLSEKLGNSPDGQRRAPARRAAPSVWRSGTPS